jgi:hypothetical protein
MASQDLRLLFAGSDDESLLVALHRRIGNPRNDVQRTFCDAWDAIELVHSDGFEMLLAQGTPLENYAAALCKIGLPQVQPIFARVLALIPPHFRLPENQQALFEHLNGLFEELKELAYAFYGACVEVVPIASRYVRQHRDDFCEYAGGSTDQAEPDAAADRWP